MSHPHPALPPQGGGVEHVLAKARGVLANMVGGGSLPYENLLLLRGQAAIANEIGEFIGPGARVLDWGGGRGWLSYLLDGMGFKVTYYDFAGGESHKPLSLLPNVEKLFIEEGTGLPFEGESFDAIVSCGVLEHVPDLEGSLGEINRILTPGGRLFVYHFPNRYSYTEFLARRIGQDSHDVLMTRSEFVAMLESGGLTVERFYYKYLLPRNLPGFPRLRRFVSRADGLVFTLDRALVRIPGLRKIATSLNGVAAKG